MDWMELLKQFFIVCVFPFLGLLGVYVCKWLDSKREKVNVEIDNELCKEYVDMLTETIKDCVIATNQTYVESLKSKGEFGVEAQKEAFQKTFDAVLTILSDEAKEYLTAIFGDLTVYITNKIEEEVVENKKKDTE